jgi:hypothetical protein
MVVNRDCHLCLSTWDHQVSSNDITIEHTAPHFWKSQNLVWDPVVVGRMLRLVTTRLNMWKLLATVSLHKQPGSPGYDAHVGLYKCTIPGCTCYSWHVVRLTSRPEKKANPVEHIYTYCDRTSELKYCKNRQDFRWQMNNITEIKPIQYMNKK